jgi:hypothetical protein
VADPLIDDPPGRGTGLHVPERELVEEVRRRLAQGGAPSPSSITNAFAAPEVWPDRGDWLVVGCFDDGTARYGLAPFGAVAEVTNPLEACAAILRVLP